MMNHGMGNAHVRTHKRTGFKRRNVLERRMFCAHELQSMKSKKIQRLDKRTEIKEIEDLRFSKTQGEPITGNGLVFEAA